MSSGPFGSYQISQASPRNAEPLGGAPPKINKASAPPIYVYDRKHWSRYSIVALFLVGASLGFLLAGCMVIGPQPLQPDGKIYFVPLHEFSSPSLIKLITYYKRRYGLAIETLPSVKLEEAVVDFSRRQLIAEELIALMKRQYPELAKDPKVILIGITPGDMYIREYTWQFAFSWREEGRFAVVSRSHELRPAAGR